MPRSGGNVKRIGIDVGGTFTDVVLIDDGPGRIWFTKVATTPQDPARGALEGIRKIVSQAGADYDEIARIGHGTTIATNLIVEGKGARTALLTTKGFRDILEIRRVSRHDRADLYDLFFRNPAPLVPRRLRLEVDERIAFDGEVLQPLDPAQFQDLGAVLKEAGVEAVAICLLHAHVNPAHEQAVAAFLQKALPDVFVTSSSDVNPEMYEYERTSTTVINGMIGPKCKRYIATFEQEVGRLGIDGEVLFMQSNGGLAGAPLVMDRPVTLLESGPAGGVTAAVKLCRRIGVENAITGDMGGTTFDVSMIHAGRPQLRTSTVLQTVTVRTPTIDIESIGAGGGSIARIDEAGGVRIGPDSAGAVPGPVCYGRGGTDPTITDCNLILGYIDPDGFMDGELELDIEAARRAVDVHLARPLGVSIEEAARIVRSIGSSLMAQAIRLLTVERGFDPRDFAYIPFGGGGPVHAIEIADELDIDHVIVPNLPGLLSAFGMLIADQTYDLQQPVLANLDELTPARLQALMADLKRKADDALAAGGEGWSGAVARYSADCRYAGQAETLSVDIDPAADVTMDTIASGFAVEHQRHWNFTRKTAPVTLVNLRLQVTLPTVLNIPAQASGAGDEVKPFRHRAVVIGGERQEIACYRREALGAGTTIAGPGIIEERSSSLVFTKDWTASLDGEGNIHVKRNP